MFLSNASVRRPIAMGCLIIGLTLLGVNAWRKMGLELLPKMDLPYVTIVTVYPGASPEEIEVDVAKRIEDAVTTIDGLKHVTSSCMENVCQTLLEFQLDVDVDIAATDVREKLDLIRAELPADVEDPKIQKYDINAMPIVTLALTGDAPIDELYDYADNTLRDRLTVIAGVADVQLVGGAEREVHVRLARKKLAARGLSSLQVVQAIQQGVRTIPSGRVRERGAEYSVKFDADYDRLVDIGGLEIAGEAGQRCYVRDVGAVAMASEELRQAAWLDGQAAIAIKVIKKADANAVRVADKVREAMGKLEARLPGGMDLEWVADDGRFIEATNASAWVNVLQGILLTAAVLFLFLYNLRALLVVSITMPLTIVIGLFFMQMAGFTLNTSTLIAVGMSVGILVTNSIVVLEAIVKRLKATGDAREAARLGTGEAAVAIIASAGTNVVVLFPLAVMHSMIGLFIAPLALTMFIMTVVSLFISFTLTPILCSALLKAQSPESRSILARVERVWNRGLDRVVGGYRAVLVFTERRRWAAVLVLLGVAALLAHSLWIAGSLGSSMIADSDKGEIYVKLEFPTRYDLAHTVERVHEVETRLGDLPELRHVLSTIGKVEGTIGKSSEGVYLAQVLLKFSERDERTLTSDDLEARIRSRLADFPGAIVTVAAASVIGGQDADIDMEIAGESLATLDRLALRTRQVGETIPGFGDVDTSVRTGKPELRVRPRRPVLADMGVPVASLGLNLRANLEGMEAGTFKREARNYDIVVKLAEQEGKDQVDRFLLPGEPGHPLLLRNVAHVEEGRTPVLITRKDKQRISKVYANLAPGLPLGSGVAKLGEAMDAQDLLPPGYERAFVGRYETMSEGMAGLGEAALVAIVLMVLTLAAILESFRQPLLILVTLPLALIGMFWALSLSGESMGIFVIMGAVMMIGIVVNNAILIMDRLNVHVREGIPPHKAMVAAACDRFRPIVMITSAAVLGMLPMALGQGVGAEIRNGVGIASAGGILVSGVLTLLVMPVLYDLFTRRQTRESTS
jgi:hydrophobic/amphiphilic exporter-1 (mainly G- bacteria), HAE1 family